MDKLWKTRTPPTPLRVEEVCVREELETDGSDLSSSLPDQRVWTLGECVETFVQW